VSVKKATGTGNDYQHD